jgi:predicted metal-dependent HD superfamily phosphohydrolase
MQPDLIAEKTKTHDLSAMDNSIISEVKQYVEELFLNKYDNRSSYHSYEHTKEVAEAAGKIGKGSGLSKEELEAVVIAAWFHDTGYLFEQKNHEEQSVKLAEEFLSSRNYPEEKIKHVKDCILATRMNSVPANLMEEVIHDADYINLSNNDNMKQSELLRSELINYGGTEPTEEEWLTSELKFLLNHRYYTEYAKNKLEDKKADNIKKLKKKLKKARESEAFVLKEVVPYKKPEAVNEKIKEEEKEKKEDKKEEKKEEVKEKKEDEKRETNTVKGFETIYRLTAANHMRLNAIADRKANIMLTLNGIVVSITMSIVAADSSASMRSIIPSSLLIIACLITIVFATLATRPTVTIGKISKQAIEDKKANLLFFGNFSRMEFQDFDWGIKNMIRDREYLHNAMIEDFYNLGKVLDQKFRYLRICYNVFMYGIIISVLSIAVLMGFGF